MHANSKDHRALATWAAACAERVLELFEEAQPGDKRVRAAMHAARNWAKGNLSVAEARKAALAAYEAARMAQSDVAREAARSAGHAAETAHEPNHAPHAANYAVKAVLAAGGDADAEEAWQDERVPTLGAD